MASANLIIRMSVGMHPVSCLGWHRHNYGCAYQTSASCGRPNSTLSWYLLTGSSRHHLWRHLRYWVVISQDIWSSMVSCSSCRYSMLSGSQWSFDWSMNSSLRERWNQHTAAQRKRKQNKSLKTHFPPTSLFHYTQLVLVAIHTLLTRNPDKILDVCMATNSLLSFDCCISMTVECSVHQCICLLLCMCSSCFSCMFLAPPPHRMMCILCITSAWTVSFN